MQPHNGLGALPDQENPDERPPFGLVGDYSPGGDALTRHATRVRQSGAPLYVYLSGPMTGIEDMNVPAFNDAARLLCKRGIRVFVPTVHPDGWGPALARDLTTILTGGIDALVMLDGWHRSRGARLETYTAAMMNLPLYWYRTGEPVLTRSLVLAWTEPFR